MYLVNDYFKSVRARKVSRKKLGTTSVRIHKRIWQGLTIVGDHDGKQASYMLDAAVEKFVANQIGVTIPELYELNEEQLRERMESNHGE